MIFEEYDEVERKMLRAILGEISLAGKAGVTPTFTTLLGFYVSSPTYFYVLKHNLVDLLYFLVYLLSMAWKVYLGTIYNIVALSVKGRFKTSRLIPMLPVYDKSLDGTERSNLLVEAIEK
jgi:hypothetical protein